METDLKRMREKKKREKIEQQMSSQKEEKQTLLLEQERNEHKKTLQKLLSINNLYEEQKLELESLRLQLKKQSVSHQSEPFFPSKFDNGFISSMLLREVNQAGVEKLIREYREKESFEREKMLFDLKYTSCDQKENVFQYFQEKNFEMCLRLVIELIVVENEEATSKNSLSILQVILDRMLKIRDVNKCLKSLIRYISQVLPPFDKTLEAS